MRLTGKRYASVTDLVRDTTDTAFAEEFEKHLADRQITLTPPAHTGADPIRYHVASIERELEELESLAGGEQGEPFPHTSPKRQRGD